MICESEEWDQWLKECFLELNWSHTSSYNGPKEGFVKVIQLYLIVILNNFDENFALS